MGPWAHPTGPIGPRRVVRLRYAIVWLRPLASDRDDVRDLDQEEQHDQGDEEPAADHADPADVADDVAVLLRGTGGEKTRGLGAAWAGCHGIGPGAAGPGGT